MLSPSSAAGSETAPVSAGAGTDSWVGAVPAGGARSNGHPASHELELVGPRPSSTASVRGCEAIFEGELHNRPELGRELGRADGGDAQVALDAYLRWGRGALARLRGVFA